MIGCGTAYNSCLTAKYWLEELTSIDVEIDIASEFRYRKLKFNSNNLYIFVSQSGETADTAAALDLCKKNNVKTCSIVNVIESSIARNSDWVLPICWRRNWSSINQSIFRAVNCSLYFVFKISFCEKILIIINTLKI